MYQEKMFAKYHPVYSKLMDWFRIRRRKKFINLTHLRNGMKILDLGGEPYFWEDLPLDCEIICLNISESISNLKNVKCVKYNGTQIPFENKSFDMVHSNSVIEHVGDFASQLRFASEIKRVGKGYWIQVPNWNFPYEPHARFPFFQFLPHGLRLWISRRWKYSFYKTEDLLCIRLLTKSELKYLFNNPLIYAEKLGFLTKSICAYFPVIENND